MAEQSEFIAKLKRVLNEVGSITKDESKEAYSLIIDRLWESIRLSIRRDELNNKQTINQSDHDLAIIGGKQKATPSERYWALHRYFHQPDVIKLKELPYNDFLKTIYWHIVRDYVVSQRGGKCELCGKMKNLHVHHKTYENHGMEHANLNDLMVLCKVCHAKFHDKDKFDDLNK
jgi:5-methylcytosine-specific restriction endonuclease McrA